jgi:hypothetical protein
MVDPTQEDTIDPCLGGVLLGGSSHIWGYVRSSLRPADPCMGEVLWGGAAPFFNIAISPELSPNLPGEAENGLDCHSQHLDTLLRGRTERFGCGRIISICL